MMTGQEMADLINAALLPHFGHMMYKCRYDERYNEPCLHITYASAPKEAPEIDGLNAKVNLMLSLEPVPGHLWRAGAPAPEKIKVHQFRGNHGLFRAKTGTPAQVVTYIIKFFTEHREELLHPVGRR